MYRPRPTPAYDKFIHKVSTTNYRGYGYLFFCVVAIILFCVVAITFFFVVRDYGYHSQIYILFVGIILADRNRREGRGELASFSFVGGASSPL